MNKYFTSFKTLTIVSFKMFFRNKGAIIFTLIVPLALLAVFGFLSKGGQTNIKIDVTNNAQSQIAMQLVDSLKKIPTFKTIEVSENKGNADLGKGDVDLQVVIPEQFGALVPNSDTVAPSQVITHYNQAKPGNGQVANLIIGQIISGFNTSISHTPQIISLQSSGVKTNNLGFFDFILPGILAMIIMQSGIFAVAFAFVSFKASGALRRLHATPVHPRVFVFAQAVTRLVVTLLTIAILIGFGTKFFGFHMLGSYWEFTFVAILGILIFLGFGFAIAGYAKDENQVAPLANLIQLPMLLLSGIFFPRDSFPAWLQTVTNYFPLTYLGDALRHIANEGQHLPQLGHDLLGLSVWVIVTFVAAIMLFRWE